MKSVLVVVSVLALAHHVFATSCSGIQEYNTTLIPACSGTDIYVLWPNYENFSEYYRCQGVGNPVLVGCAENTFFSYYLQICNDCEDFLPAPACEELRTSSTPECVAIENSTTEAPTTEAPTTEAPTTEAPTTEAPTTEVTTTEAPTTEAPTTEAPTTEAPTTEAPTTETPTTTSSIPMPPSPSTSAPGIPTPVTPAPTPPSVVVTPPSEPSV